MTLPAALTEPHLSWTHLLYSRVCWVTVRCGVSSVDHYDRVSLQSTAVSLVVWWECSSYWLLAAPCNTGLYTPLASEGHHTTTCHCSSPPSSRPQDQFYLDWLWDAAMAVTGPARAGPGERRQFSPLTGLGLGGPFFLFSSRHHVLQSGVSGHSISMELLISMLTRTSAMFTLESEISLSSFLSYANMFIRSSSNQSSLRTEFCIRPRNSGNSSKLIHSNSYPIAPVSTLLPQTLWNVIVTTHADGDGLVEGQVGILFISQKFSFEITISHVRKENNKDDCWLSRGEF